MSGRTVKSSKSIITGIANKFILLVLAFVSRKIFIHYIGVEYLGINSLFSDVLNLLSMADLGFGIAIAYSYYEPLAKGDHEKLSALTGFYKRIYNIIALAVALIGLFMIPFLKYIVNMEQEIPHLYIYYVIILSNTVLSYLFVYKSTIITADQKGYLINRINIYINVIRTVLQCIALVLFESYLVYIILQSVGTLLNNFVISFIADKQYPFLKNKNYLAAEEKRNIIENMKSVFLYKVAASLMGGTDSLIMSKICGTVIVGLYSNYLTITMQLTSVVQIVFQSLTASVGNLLLQKDTENSYIVFKQMQMISHWMSATISVCVLTLVQDFIVLWLGEEYLMSMTMVWAIAANLYFSIAMQPIWSFREASGLYNKTKYVMLCTVVVNIALSVFLGIQMGAPGVILASVIARLTTYFWYEPALIFKLYFQKKSSGYYFDFLVSCCLIVISYFVINVVSYYFRLTSLSILNWFIKAIISIFVIFSFYLLRYHKKNEFRELRNKVIRVIKMVGD